MSNIKVVKQHLGVLQNNDIKNIFGPLKSFLGNQKNNSFPISLECVVVCKNAWEHFITYKDDSSNRLSKKLASTLTKRMEEVFGVEMMKKWKIESKIYFRLADDEIDIEIYVNPV